MAETANDTCIRCKGLGWYWRTPDGFNPFLAGGFQTARAMYKVNCNCSAVTPAPVSRAMVSDTPSAALEAPLNSFEKEVLEMLAGMREGQWGAWVGAVLGTLSGRGLCTRGPNYQITDAGRAALEASHE